MKSKFSSLLALGALLVGLTTGAVQAQGTTATPPNGRPAVLPPAGVPPASALIGQLRGHGGQLPPEVGALLERFRAQSEALLAERRVLLSGMASATVEERQAAIAALRELQKGLAVEQRELARQVREELRTLREARRNGGG